MKITSVKSGFYEGFEDFVNGLDSWETGIESGGTGSVSIITTDSSEGTACLHIDATSVTYHAWAERTGIGITSNCIYEVDLKIGSGYSGYASYVNLENSSGTRFITFMLGYSIYGAEIEYYDGSSYQEVSRDIPRGGWFNLRLNIDFSTNTYDIYIDGILEVSGAVFRASSNELDIINFTAGGGSANTGSLKVDEIKINQL